MPAASGLENPGHDVDGDPYPFEGYPHPDEALLTSLPAARPRATLGALTSRLSTSFRLHGAYDPAPRPHRMVGMCTWAAALGVIGLAVAVRALLAILSGLAPKWFEPVVVATGLVGIVLTVGGFMAIHQRRLPWVLLGASSATLVVNLLVTISY